MAVLSLFKASRKRDKHYLSFSSINTINKKEEYRSWGDMFCSTSDQSGGIKTVCGITGARCLVVFNRVKGGSNGTDKGFFDCSVCFFSWQTKERKLLSNIMSDVWSEDTTPYKYSFIETTIALSRPSHHPLESSSPQFFSRSRAVSTGDSQTLW